MQNKELLTSLCAIMPAQADQGPHVTASPEATFLAPAAHPPPLWPWWVAFISAGNAGRVWALGKPASALAGIQEPTVGECRKVHEEEEELAGTPLAGGLRSTQVLSEGSKEPKNWHFQAPGQTRPPF